MGSISWVIQRGAKCNHNIFIKKEAEGDLTRGEGDVTIEAEIRVI